MKKTLAVFKGELPRIAPNKLPPDFAVSAINTRLLSGDLERWGSFGSGPLLTKEPPINTIYYLGQSAWLEFGAEMEPFGGHMDIARGVIPGDTTYRVYLTGGDAPRYTNLAMATAGPAPYPYETRLIGVPAPTTAPEVGINTDPIDPESPEAEEQLRNITDDGSNFADWTASAAYVVDFGEGVSATSTAVQDSGIGNPSPSYRITKVASGIDPVPTSYLSRNFGTANDAVVIFACDIRTTAGVSSHTVSINADPNGRGPAVRLLGAGTQMSMTLGVSNVMATGDGFTPSNDPLTASGFIAETWYRLEVSLTKQSDGTATLNAKLKSGSTVILEQTLGNAGPMGGYFWLSGFMGQGWYDNLVIQARGTTTTSTTPTSPTSPPEESADPTATAYVVTFVNDLGEESAPSPPSLTVLRPDGVSTTVTMPTAPPTGPEYYITTKRLYRAVTGATGTSFQFVAEMPLEDAEYVDSLTDLELGEVLESDNWDLPPSDLRGILALPNGVMTGFRRNQLCFSVQNRPHAWPVEHRLNTDTDIVGIGAVGTTVVIGTESYPYIASGNNPAAYSMEKLEVPQACVAKRSVATISGVGVVFATPDGLIAVSGPGRPLNLTEALFTRDEWQALNPHTFISFAHDDRYWAFYLDASGNQRGMILDLKQGGFGKITLACHATAAYADPVTDELYLVLDYADEPSSPLGPPPYNPDATGTQIYTWNQHNSEVQLQYSYTGPLWQVERPVYFNVAQVKAREYGSIVVTFYVDGIDVYSKVVYDENPFVLPPIRAKQTFQINIIGTAPVSMVQVAEDVEELD